jgi:hypothetical protein
LSDFSKHPSGKIPDIQETVMEVFVGQRRAGPVASIRALERK